MNSVCTDCGGCRAGGVAPAGAGPQEGDKGKGRLSGGAQPRERAGAAAGLALGRRKNARPLPAAPEYGAGGNEGGFSPSSAPAGLYR